MGKALLGAVMASSRGDWTFDQARRLEADRSRYTGKQEDRIDALQARVDGLEQKVDQLVSLLQDWLTGRVAR